MTSDATELRVSDLMTFLAVARSVSLTAAARERKVTPSQVSKAIARLEGHFARRLIDRGSRGVALSDAGRDLIPTIESVVGELTRARTPEAATQQLTLGAPSYLQASLLPVLAAAVPTVRIAAFERSPQVLRARAHDEGFDLVLLPGAVGLQSRSWHSEIVGELRKGLFASPTLAHRLGPGPVSAAQLAELPFVCPIDRRDRRIILMDDECPLPRSQRRVGHEVGTIHTALEVAATTHQLVFGPTIAAQHHLRVGALVEIEVIGWTLREPLSFACHVDRVSARQRAALTVRLRAAMRGS